MQSHDEDILKRVRRIEIKTRGLSDEIDIELSGGLCTNNCPDGPVVIVNDKIYKHVNSGVMGDILEQYFPAKAE